mgnify:FL=1
MEKEVEKENLRGIVTNGYFIDIGVPEDYQKAQIELVEQIEIKK